MILVSFAEFKQFLSEEKINDQAILPAAIPCILQFMKGETIKAKIEVVNAYVYKWNEKYGLKSFRESKNKYWIRGKERV